MTTDSMPNVLLRWAELEGRFPGKKTKLYSDIKKGLWTRPIKFSHKLRVWPAAEIRKLVAARAQGYTDDQIRALVNKLHAERGLPLAAESNPDRDADRGPEHLRPGAGRGQGEREAVRVSPSPTPARERSSREQS